VSFNSERIIKSTRKPHLCEGCGQTIPAGSTAQNWTGLTDGDFASVYYHPECREAEIMLNELAGTWAGEWISLQDRDPYYDAWILTDFPIVAERLNISAKGKVA
jgi:hypothetical protein